MTKNSAEPNLKAPLPCGTFFSVFGLLPKEKNLYYERQEETCTKVLVWNWQEGL